MASTSRKHPSFPKEMSAGKFQHLATEILHKIQNVPYRVQKLVDSWYIRKVPQFLMTRQSGLFSGCNWSIRIKTTIQKSSNLNKRKRVTLRLLQPLIQSGNNSVPVTQGMRFVFQEVRTGKRGLARVSGKEKQL
jgi:hypothetical protein